jgi:hypothetical protein
MLKGTLSRDVLALVIFPVKRIPLVPVDKPINGFEYFQNVHGAIGIYILYNQLPLYSPPGC